MIRYVSQKQLPLEGFDTPPGMIFDPNNRWVKLKDCLPWDELNEAAIAEKHSSVAIFNNIIHPHPGRDFFVLYHEDET